MKKHILFVVLTFVICAFSFPSFGGHGLLYRAPAEDSAVGWERQSLPVGCGYFGANVFGIVGDERVQVTHNAILKPDPKNAKKGVLTNALEIRLKTGHTNVTDYARGLDLDRAVAWTEYRAEGVRYRREVFASYPDKVLVMRLTADKPGALSFRLEPTVPFLEPIGKDKFGRTVGRTAETKAVGNDLEVYQELAGFGVRCAAAFRVVVGGHAGRVTLPDGTTSGVRGAPALPDGTTSGVRGAPALPDGTTCGVRGAPALPDGVMVGRSPRDRRDATNGVLVVSGATEATVVMAMETNYRLAPETFAEKDWTKKLPPTDPRPAARAVVAAAAEKGYEALLKRHVEDYAALYGRVEIDLGGAVHGTAPTENCAVHGTAPTGALHDAEVTTDELLARYRKGERSRYLEETYVQFGRYLLISSSRPGTLPANLQGVWNCHDAAPWGSGYWHNINVQMNYWPAFSGNLAECFEPYVAFNEAARPSKSMTCYSFVREFTPENLPAADEPLPDWWILGTANYPYLAIGGPGAHDGPGIGGLTTRLFTDWWEFTQDEDVLEKHAFPALHGMANFLVRTVRNYDGKCLAAFSASPEQFIPNRRESWTDPDIGIPYYHTIGCAFDQQLLWQNAHDLIRMADALKTNDWVVAKCREQLDRYDPVQIGASGQIKEFREENAYGEIGEKEHRHISHLVGLMPGTLINRTTPAWLEAAKTTLVYRTDHSTGWALAHRLNAWARTGDGDHAYRLFANLIGERTNDNLWDMHPPFQIDGNFGGTAGVIEMLLQSHEGYIELLPALPSEWAKGGSFRGLCARGAFEVDCAWSNGVPTRVAVRSKKGNVPDIRFRGKPLEIALTVEFTLRPEPESEIRCRMALPPKSRWNGELWGLGNSSFGGFLFDLDMFVDENAAAVTTDLGTARYVSGHSSQDDWPEAVFKDYAWRATHLMTLCGKRFVKAYYGKPQRYALFIGGSCGGRQAHSEAMRYPEDYDGIVSITPAAMATASSAQAFNVYRRAHDETGKELFTTNQFRILADAAIAYAKDREPAPYAGHILVNPFWTEKEIDGFLDHVVKMEAFKAARLESAPYRVDDLKPRLKGIFMGDVDDAGRTVCHGMLPSVMLGNRIGMSFRHNKLCACNYRVTGPDGRVRIRNYNVFSPYPSWTEFEEKAVRHSAEINASATELRAFAGRGGKMVVVCGLEDQTTPAPETIAWYEELARNHGGLEKTKAFCRLFALPGIAHGGGRGRIGVMNEPQNKVCRALLRKWIREEVAPETYPLAWPQRKLTIPVPTYPEMSYQDKDGQWKRVRYPPNPVRHPHSRYFETE